MAASAGGGGGWYASEVLAAAEGLPQPLRDVDALALTLVLSRDPHPRYPRAAARLLGRLLLHDQAWTLQSVRDTATALSRLADSDSVEDAASSLQMILVRGGREDLAREVATLRSTC